MGLIQGKSKRCLQSCGCACHHCGCTCINCTYYASCSSGCPRSPGFSLYSNRGHHRQQLPARTTAFSGHPFYSCQHQKKSNSKSNCDHHQRKWFSSVTKMCEKMRGFNVLSDPKNNKDMAFTLRERESLGLKGLLPPAVRSQEMQVKAVMDTIRALSDQLAKYMYLRDLQDYNERLFYRVLSQYTEELMPIVYTPVVGEACMKFSHIYKRPRGLYITVHDAGHVYSLLSNWSEKNIKAICVTDGERILGLGDLGANGMGIPIGKLSLYTALAGVPPYLTLPVTIDVGTNNESLLNDPLYIGLKQKRVRGPQYDDLIDEFMEAVIKKWGRSCLIQFEDFGNANAFRLLEKYKENFCTFNDDIQGTASVAVAGIFASAKVTGLRLVQNTFLFLGAGEAAIGIADFLVKAMEVEGLSIEEARSKIWLVDSKGLVTIDRPSGGVEGHKKKYAKKAENCTELEKAIDMVKPTALIGVSAQHNAFNETVLKKMSAINKRPVIFALSNPTSKAECTAEDAYVNTEGRCVFASGSPFSAVTVNGQKFHPGQGNNAYIFPGVALAVMACNVHQIPDETFLVAARALADLVSKEDILEGRMYPPLQYIREVCLQIAAKVTQYFFVENLATIRPEPDDKLLFMRGKQYDFMYSQNNNNHS